jgi:hypothetical protein
VAVAVAVAVALGVGVGSVGSPSTVIVPVMPWSTCAPHTNAYVPGFVNVKDSVPLVA